jgi:hypothetical protein
MLRKKIIKRCPKGHRMDLSWRRCPRCTGRIDAQVSTRELTDLTVVAEEAPPAADATRVLDSSELSAERIPIGRLVALAGPLTGQELRLLPGRNQIGKGPRESPQFPDSPSSQRIAVPADRYMSREHASLDFQHGQLLLLDDGSTNGTFVNGERTQRAVLRDGDELRLGESVFRLVLRR